MNPTLSNARLDRASYVNEVRVVQLIMVRSIRGRGTDESPIIEVTEFYDAAGRLVARSEGTGTWDFIPHEGLL